jgi:tyrosyl-tRNA synthetase
VISNAQTYKQQVSRILDTDKMQIVFNSEWFDTLSVLDLLRLTMHATVSQMLARADFKKRLAKADDISLLEFMYPLLQGFDSVKLEADVELGGTDQIFNLLVGRDMQRDFAQPQQVVITMPLLEGTDGVQKMSKSFGNYIGIQEPPDTMFGKIMSISDELMLRYYELLTDQDLGKVKECHPREAKVNLARLIVEQYHGRACAEEALGSFEKVFKNKEIPDNVAEYKFDSPIPILDALTRSGLVSSRNEARRLISQGGVMFCDRKITEENFLVSVSGILKVGTRRFLKVVIA